MRGGADAAGSVGSTATATQELLRRAWELRKAPDPKGMVQLLSAVVPREVLGDELELVHLLSWGLREIGEFRKSLDLQLEFERAFRLRGNDWLLRWWLLVAGTNWLNVGSAERARESWLECMELASRENDQYSLAWATNNLGGLDSYVGQLGDALSNFQRAIAANQRMGYRRGLALAYHNTADIYNQMGRYDEAVSTIGRAYDYARSLQSDLLLKWHQVVRARSFIGTGDLEAGEALLQSSLPAFVGAGVAYQTITARTELGRCLRLAGRRHEALGLLTDALALARRTRARLLQVFVLTEIALLLDGNDRPRAVRAARRARMTLLQFGSTYHLDRVFDEFTMETREELLYDWAVEQRRKGGRSA